MDQDSEVDMSKMTARQRAAHVGEDSAFMALPDGMPFWFLASLGTRLTSLLSHSPIEEESVHT